MTSNQGEGDLKKQNDDLMAQLQLGLAELKTTVGTYPERSNKARNSTKTPKHRPQPSIYKDSEFRMKDIKEDIKLRRSSRNTSTPKMKKTVSIGNTSSNNLSLLIADAGNLRPGKKTALEKSDNIAPIKSSRSSSRIKTPLKEKKAVSSRIKSPSLKKLSGKQLKTPTKGKTDFNISNKSPGNAKLRSSRYLTTPKSVGNLKPGKKSNLNRSSRKTPMKSILQSSKRAKTPSKGNHVCFSPALNKDESRCKDEPHCSRTNTTVDTTMMGYDWIAGMLDNDTSVNDRSDNFFHELKEFRKANWNDCKGIKSSDTNTTTCETSALLSPALKHTEKENYPLCCKGNGAYMVNNRLNLVPVHGPYSACPSCKSKPISQCDADGYVRVSIPRSTIKSPYKLRPHRRKSYDPSDSVALSMHCLAGWQASKPACIRGPSNVDLGSHIAKRGLTSVKAVKGGRFRC